jgi:hypothetical protein
VENAIKRIIQRLFPELVGRYHLPHFAKVVAVAADRGSSKFCDELNPHYSVDVQILDKNLKDDKRFQVLTDLPVTLPGAGHDRGLLGLPRKGAIVEIAFAYGLPSHPFIRSVLPHGFKLPGIEGDEVRWHQSKDVYQRADKDGNWERSTTKDITDSCDNLTEQIEKIRDSLAKEKQLIKVAAGGKIWLGNNADNVLQLLSDLAGVVNQLATSTASHTHASGPAPDQAVAITVHATSATTMKTSLDVIVE